MLLQHGAEDAVVPAAQAESLHAALAAQGVVTALKAPARSGANRIMHDGSLM